LESFALTLQAQNYLLMPYQTESGLPTNLVKAVVKDTLGFIWIASDEGVSRFDGRNYVNFKKQLPSSYTKSLFVTKKGKLLVINDLGIIQISSRLDSADFKTLIEGGTTTADNKRVMYPKEIFEDCAGNLWISEPNSVLTYQNGKIKRYNFPSRLNTTVYLRSFHFAETDCQNLYAVAFMGALLYFDRTKDQFIELDLKEWKLRNISTLTKINENTLWLGHAEGILEVKVSNGGVIEKISQVVDLEGVSYFKFDDRGDLLVGTWANGIFRILMQSTEKIARKIEESFARVINHIFVDNENNIWLSSDDGIELLKPNLFSRYATSKENPYIQAIHWTKDQSLLVCDGAYVYKIRKDSAGLSSERIYNYPKSNILSVTESNGNLFIGAGNDRLLCVKGSETIELDLSPFGKAVFSLFADRQANVWVCQYGERVGVVKVSPQLVPQYYTEKQGIKSQITVVRETNGGAIYCGGRGKDTYLYVYHETQNRFENISLPLKISSQNLFEVNDIFFDKAGQIWIGSNQGLWLKKKNSIELINLGPRYSQENIKAVLIDEANNVWIGTNLGIIKYKDGKFVLFEKVNGLSTVTISQRGLVQNSQGNLFVATANGLNYMLERTEDVQITPAPQFLYLKADNQKVEVQQADLSFAYQTTLEGRVLSFTYPNNRVLYQYRVLGLNKNWSEPSELNQILIQRIPNGSYTLQIRAKQQGNYDWSKPLSLKFEIKKPWYLSWASLATFFLIFISLMWVALNLYTLRLKRQRALLTQKVSEATQEVEARAESLKQANALLQKQALEINQQKENITRQKNTIEDALRTIARKNKQITDSLRYAQTIQKVILPEEHLIKQNFKDYFLIYQPKDVVSGDFYWVFKTENKLVLAVVDCTGHGVPGAFMSMIGYSLLYRIIKLKGVDNPSDIMRMLHTEIRVVLRQKDGTNTDGMDVCLCVIEKFTNTQNQTKFRINFCGAKRPLYYFTSDSLYMLEGDRKSVGGWQGLEKDYTNQEIVLYENDMIYLSTDGLADQNNLKRRKFGENQMLRILEKNARLAMIEQKRQIEEALSKHQENTDQRDDITLLGVKL
jgi:ligand-binding sensor domain-containing protein/serine phosphatase RsbU (regulator of sigma subunit)